MIDLQKLLTYEEFEEVLTVIEDASTFTIEELIPDKSTLDGYHKMLLDIFPTEESIDQLPQDTFKIMSITKLEDIDDLDVEDLQNMDFDELNDLSSEMKEISKEELKEIRKKALEYKEKIDKFNNRIEIFGSIIRKLKPIKDVYNTEEKWNGERN